MELRSRARNKEAPNATLSNQSKEEPDGVSAPSATDAPPASLGRLLFLASGIWGCFIFWGILQQKVTTHAYPHKDTGMKERWPYMVIANMCMGAMASLVGGLAYTIHARFGGKGAPPTLFIRAAFSNTIASPIGYLGVTYNLISFPLSLLVKNCKLVPVMIVGALINKIKYSPREYLAVGLISVGVPIFMMKPSKCIDGEAATSHDGCYELSKGASSLEDWAGVVFGCAGLLVKGVVDVLSSTFTLKEICGVGLAATNLLIDGFTNAEQDRINRQYKPSAFYMMCMVNFWGVVLALAFLLADLAWRGTASQLYQAQYFFFTHPSIQPDLFFFCLSNALGQVFIFSTIKDFGPLVSVTVAITRKLITLGLSILRGDDPVYWWHWVGVALVFAGVGVGSFKGGKKSKTG